MDQIVSPYRLGREGGLVSPSPREMSIGVMMYLRSESFVPIPQKSLGTSVS